MAPGMWAYTAKEDVGFGDAIYSSIDEAYPGSRPRQVHVSQMEVAQKAHEGEPLFFRTKVLSLSASVPNPRALRRVDRGHARPVRRAARRAE